MEDNLNGRRPLWKTTLVEDNLSGRRPQWKTTSVEDDLSGRRPQWKTTSVEDDLRGRRAQWKMNLVENNISGRRTRWKTTSVEEDLSGRRPQWKTTLLAWNQQNLLSNIGKSTLVESKSDLRNLEIGKTTRGGKSQNPFWEASVSVKYFLRIAGSSPSPDLP